MDHAWLDSLSEDWVSQAGSSGSPAPSLPSLTDSKTVASSEELKSSRIPRFDSERKLWAAPQEKVASPLSERSLNDHNIPLSQRGTHQPSKLRDDITNDPRGRKLSRTVSASTSRSFECSTVQHKSASLSPGKGSHHTPEWRRRLLQGDVAYGDQCDLFSPAGLENLFRPPNQDDIQSKAPFAESSIMRSSPPPYHRRDEVDSAFNNKSDEFVRPDDETSTRKQPRNIKYNMIDDYEDDYSFAGSEEFDVAEGSMNDQSAQLANGTASVRQKARLEDARTVSGQSDMRNEDFSPVIVGKHNVMGDNLADPTRSLPPKVLQHKLEQIQESSSSSQSPELDDSYGTGSREESVQSISRGRFVNLRRGGYSQEGSFIRRPLSPSSLPAFDESAMLREESIQASTPKILPNTRNVQSSDRPVQSEPVRHQNQNVQTPLVSPSKSTEKTSGGSPLKLFGNYDTFTNQKLLRRLSQFEDKHDSQDSVVRPRSRDLTTQRSRKTLSTIAQSPDTANSDQKRLRPRNITSFGKGDLDDYQFSEDISHDIVDINSGSRREDIPPSLHQHDVGSKLRLQLYPSLTSRTDDATTNERVGPSQQRYSFDLGNQGPDISHPSIHESSGILEQSSHFQTENLRTPRKDNGDSDNKRLLKSPPKDSTPKRRRTLQKAEIARLNEEQSDILADSHQQLQNVLSRKRKDARHGEELHTANPKVLAMRQILRPRNPTPSQKAGPSQRQSTHELDDSLDSEQAGDVQARRILQIQAELDMQDSGQLSTSTAPGQRMQNESRKGSVTTQDFLDEAKKIMAGIRGKARSGLASLEESEMENERQSMSQNPSPHLQMEDSYQESTQEPFSRPPSREGKPVETRARQQDDPVLLDHLRKYQEVSDLDMVIASSVKSIAMAKEITARAREIDQLTTETISQSTRQDFDPANVVTSDPPNIRITENPEVQRKRKHSSSSVALSSRERGENEYPTGGSDASSGPSTAGTIPTGSSRGSDSRRNIAPHTVSHLIPEEIAGMFLDRERNIWIKRKPEISKSDLHGMSDCSEDDPFGDIPDLSVDETQERRGLNLGGSHGDLLPQDVDSILETVHTSKIPEMYDEAPSKFPQAVLNLSHAKESLPIGMFEVDQEEKVDTRSEAFNATKNYNLEVRSSEKLVGFDVYERSSEHSDDDNDDDVEREISILEDRTEKEDKRQRRNVTISFSSPVAQVMSPIYDSSIGDGSYETRGLDKRSSRVNDSESMPFSKKEGNPRRSNPNIRSALRTTSRRLSLGGHNFLSRPVSRIEERDEEVLSIRETQNRCNSISLIASTPLPERRETSVVVATPLPFDIGNLSLTPLSEFTVHQADRSFGMDVSYVEGGRRFALGIDAKRTLSLSIKELVEKITQVEPYEPYWEHMKAISLRDKNLTNVHKLDEFCEQLVELDASHNRISQLDGVPPTVRDLRINHNQLSDLAAWGHLRNLQYVDVSNNEIESLSGFRHMVHLRGLKADNNKIRSIEGISQLSGLLQLRLRGNAIEGLDFANCGLHRLTDLDVKDNEISQVRNLHELKALSSLNLEENSLTEFAVQNPLRALRYLKLSGNSLEKLDVSRFSDLRLLYLDRNRLESVQGLLKTKYLDSLSMREQQDGVYIDTAFLAQALEVRKLFLSGNLLTTFQLQVEYLNLQYLELANCGIETLSPEFGYMIPNARVLNLNFNALKDIRPLTGIVRLKKLHIAGNRLSRLRTTTLVISEMQTLSVVDLRNNPLTQGFYPAISETRLIAQGQLDEDISVQPFVLKDAQRGDDTKYVSRLDQATKMRRRTLEMLLLGSCRRLRVLDGLPVDRSVLTSKDVLWKAMVTAGLLRAEEDEDAKDVQAGPPATKKDKSLNVFNNSDGEGCLPHDRNLKSSTQESRAEKESEDKTRFSERWQVEDSFA